MVRAPLALVLLRASRWFDARLLEELEARGWPRLTPAQSLVFAHLDEGGTSPSELSRRLGTSRQAAHELVAGLQRLDVLHVVADPGRQRGRLVVLTDTGRRLASDARQVLTALETELGTEQVRHLHDLLQCIAGDNTAPAWPRQFVPTGAGRSPRASPGPHGNRW